MNINEEKSITMSNKEKPEWSKRISSNGITKSLTVREIENGFMLRFNKYGNIGEGKNSKYIDETKEIYSKTNPLAGLNAIDELDAQAILDSLNSDDGTITV